MNDKTLEEIKLEVASDFNVIVGKMVIFSYHPLGKEIIEDLREVEAKIDMTYITRKQAEQEKVEAVRGFIKWRYSEREAFSADLETTLAIAERHKQDIKLVEQYLKTLKEQP